MRPTLPTESNGLIGQLHRCELVRRSQDQEIHISTCRGDCAEPSKIPEQDSNADSDFIGRVRTLCGSESDSRESGHRVTPTRLRMQHKMHARCRCVSRIRTFRRKPLMDPGDSRKKGSHVREGGWTTEPADLFTKGRLTQPTFDQHTPALTNDFIDGRSGLLPRF